MVHLFESCHILQYVPYTRRLDGASKFENNVDTRLFIRCQYFKNVLMLKSPYQVLFKPRKLFDNFRAITKQEFTGWTLFIDCEDELNLRRNIPKPA